MLTHEPPTARNQLHIFPNFVHVSTSPHPRTVNVRFCLHCGRTEQGITTAAKGGAEILKTKCMHLFRYMVGETTPFLLCTPLCQRSVPPFVTF